MSGISKKLMGTTAAGAEFLAIEDVFSTYLYTGNGSTQTITNGIDLAGEGGLVWLKARSVSGDHILCDTERGVNNFLSANNTWGNTNFGSGTMVTSFNSDGFSLGTGDPNLSSYSFASWTFRKAPRFFDVVTYTGNSEVPQFVNHDLGLVPGCIIIKSLTNSGNWFVWHRGLSSASHSLRLNLTNQESVDSNYEIGLNASDTQIYIDSGSDINSGSDSFVAYLFAHDPLGPSGDGSDGLIACGSYTGNGSTTGPVIDLGWEPQWILVKNADSTSSWLVVDNMRGLPVGGNNARLFPNLANAEGSYNDIEPTATGFRLNNNLGGYNNSGQTVIYIAIRRGPMRQPTSGTEVFNVEYQAGTDTRYRGYLGNPVDAWLLALPSNVAGKFMRSRLQGQGNYLDTTSTAAEAAQTDQWWDNNLGVGVAGTTYTPSTSSIHYLFRRAPGFFDVVAYTGTGTAQTVSHNLGVAPELMIVKQRNGTGAWAVYHSGLNVDSDGRPETDYMRLDNSNPAFDFDGAWNDTLPSATDFTLGTWASTNASAATYIAYLFATLPGVSKVGSYTGNGTNQTINCGFTSGARLVLIKATSTTGDWLIADTARGIVSGNDPYLELNTTNAEVTSEDWLDPDSSGFVVNEVSGSNANTSGVSYIYLAIS